MASLMPVAKQQYFNASGIPLAGGKVYTYSAGTTTPLATYTDSSGSTPNANPVVLDSRGEASIFFSAASYKIVLKDSADVTIWTQDNLAGDAAASALATLAASGGSALIGFIQSGSGAVATTVQAKLRESVSVKDFGAVGDGVTDDTVAIQAAITYLQPIGGILLFPAGTYKVTSSLNWVSTTNAGLPGIFFQGAGGTGGVYGGATTTIKSYIASGPLFQIQGTKTQASGGSGSLFINGGGISGMCLDGTNATGTSEAIRVNGWQYAEIVDVTIMKFPGDGVTQYTDAGYPNGDYSSSSLNFKNCWIWDNAGAGINQTGYVGAWSWQFNKVLFGYNGTGAIITSAGNSFTDCSFVGSGWSAAGVVRSGGIHIQAGVSSGTISRVGMRGCEFDFARLKHVTLDYIQTVSISESRFIFNDRNATGSMTPAVGLDIAPASAGSNVQSVLVDRCNMRIDTVGTLTGFKLSNTSNVVGIDVRDTVWSDNTGGAATITRYSGFVASNYNLRYGYRVTENTAVVIPGKPAPYVLMTTVAGQTINTATFDNIIFGTQEAVNAQIYPAGTSAGVIYNTSTGVFTAPQTGFYEVSCQLNFSGMTSADTVRTQITTTAGGVISFDGLGSAPSSGVFGFVIPTTKVFCAAGDTIQISARMGGTARALSTTASYASRLLIQMMP